MSATDICRGNAVLRFPTDDKLKMIASSQVKFSGSKLTPRLNLRVEAARKAVIKKWDSVQQDGMSGVPLVKVD